MGITLAARKACRSNSMCVEIGERSVLPDQETPERKWSLELEEQRRRDRVCLVGAAG